MYNNNKKKLNKLCFIAFPLQAMECMEEAMEVMVVMAAMEWVLIDLEAH